MTNFGHLYPWQVVTRLASLSLTCRIDGRPPLDVVRLKAEVEGILAEYAPRTHSSSDLYHDGGWNAVGLIAHEGDPFEDRPRPPYKKTPALACAPYIASLIDGFGTEPHRVRLMGLQPKKSIFWHYDRGETIDSAKSVRLHVPIFTNRNILFQISHEDLYWEEGEIWYGDFSFPHRLYNGGERVRIHLVMDLVVNDSIRSLFPSAFLDKAPKRVRVKKITQQMVETYKVAGQPSHLLQAFSRPRRRTTALTR
jgi:hypothetical protein